MNINSFECSKLNSDEVMILDLFMNEKSFLDVSKFMKKYDLKKIRTQKNILSICEKCLDEEVKKELKECNDIFLDLSDFVEERLRPIIYYYLSVNNDNLIKGRAWYRNLFINKEFMIKNLSNYLVIDGWVKEVVDNIPCTIESVVSDVFKLEATDSNIEDIKSLILKVFKHKIYIFDNNIVYYILGRKALWKAIKILLEDDNINYSKSVVNIYSDIVENGYEDDLHKLNIYTLNDFLCYLRVKAPIYFAKLLKKSIVNGINCYENFRFIELSHEKSEK